MVVVNFKCIAERSIRIYSILEFYASVNKMTFIARYRLIAQHNYIYNCFHVSIDRPGTFTDAWWVHSVLLIAKHAYERIL